MKKTSGIYKITNNINGKTYVGQTQDIYRRLNQHKTSLKNNTHYNIHLQRAWNRYGKNNFVFSIVEECEIERLDEKEMYWINELGSFKNGYNNTIGGGGTRGWKFDKDTKTKMKENHADVNGSNNPMFGVSLYDKLNEEEIKKWKNNLSKSKIGEKNNFYNKHHSKETKQILSKKTKDRIRKNGNPTKGRKRPQNEVEAIRKRMIGKFSGEKHPIAEKVVCLNNLESFNCIKYASEKYNVSGSSISECIAKNRKTAGKLKNGERLVWVRYSEYTNMTQKEITDTINKSKLKKQQEKELNV